MRAAAAVLLFAASLAAGNLARGSLRRSVQILEQLCLFLRLLRFRVRMHRPLGDVIAQAAADPDLSALTFLPACIERCGAGEPLPQAWRQAVKPFTRRHRTIGQQMPLASYIPALVCADGRQVDALLELYEAQARDALQDARARSERLGSLYLQIGGTVGVLLGIMIL